MFKFIKSLFKRKKESKVDLPENQTEFNSLPVNEGGTGKSKKWFDMEQKQKTIELLKIKWKDANNESIGHCSICGVKNWQLSSDIIGCVTSINGAINFNPYNFYPMILLICQSCGYSLFFNALILGLIDKEDFS